MRAMRVATRDAVFIRQDRIGPPRFFVNGTSRPNGFAQYLLSNARSGII